MANQLISLVSYMIGVHLTWLFFVAQKKLQRVFCSWGTWGLQLSRFLWMSVENMDVSKNRGKTPKWMVKIMGNPIKMDDLGVPLFLETPILKSLKSLPFSKLSHREQLLMEEIRRSPADVVNIPLWIIFNHGINNLSTGSDVIKSIVIPFITLKLKFATCNGTPSFLTSRLHCKGFRISAKHYINTYLEPKWPLFWSKRAFFWSVEASK